MNTLEQGQKKPVSVVIDREVLPGNKETFEAALKGIIEACKTFPGYLGTDVHLPESMDDRHYRIVLRFASLDELHHWENSAQRRHWIEIIDKLITAPTKWQKICGLETWFALPKAKYIVPPKRHKMAVVTWLAITPLLIVFNFLTQPLLGQLPMITRVICSTPFIVLLMTYLVMPFMAKLFAKWLYPNNA